ncbi:MAG: PEP-CTERM sorting domain-containing protein, partial [bacterium]|nr:PEP-CTERM sorting domain-containing protein [bacterium]
MKAVKIICAVGFCLLSVTGWSIPFHGVEFPGGAASFADAVVSYDPLAWGGPAPTAPYQIASEALGAPDYPEGPTEGYVSLGRGGVIVLRFTDNSLTGSNNSDNDLWIFEIGPDVEDTFVWVSKDGATWDSVGKVTGSTRGIDIGAFG